jgi:hypothetical protein
VSDSSATATTARSQYLHRNSFHIRVGHRTFLCLPAAVVFAPIPAIRRTRIQGFAAIVFVNTRSAVRPISWVIAASKPPATTPLGGWGSRLRKCFVRAEVVTVVKSGLH